MIICLGTTPTVQRTMTFASVRVDAVNRATAVLETASGKSINVARVLHALGEPAVATGFVGGDTGRAIRDDLDRLGVRHAFVDVAPKTRTCTTVIDQSARTATELVEESKPVERDAWPKLEATLDRLLGEASLLVLSGTLAPGGPQDFYAACVRRASARGVRSIVDAAGEPLRLALAAKPFLVKPNRSELARTMGVDASSDQSLRAATRGLIERGPGWAVVTMGADGAVVADGARFWRLAAPRVEAVNPIGSGDSVAAGVAAGIVRGQSVPEACVLGVACGAANAMTLAAGHVNRADVERLAREVRAEPA